MRIFRKRYRGPDGREREARRWYGEFRLPNSGKAGRVALFTDTDRSRRLAETIERVLVDASVGTLPDRKTLAMLARLPANVKTALSRWGIVALTATSPRTLREDLDAFEKHSRAKGNSPAYIRGTRQTLDRVAAALGWTTLANIQAGAVRHHLDELAASGIGAARLNRIRAAIAVFTRWAVREGRLPSDPLACIRPRRESTDRRYRRRAFSDLECGLVIAAAADGPDVLDMPGSARAIAWALMLHTGLRAREAASLTPEDFDLADPAAAVVVLGAENSKHRKTDNLPVPARFVPQLATWLSGRPPGEPVFPRLGIGKGARMLRVDLAAARTRWIDGARTPEERAEREASDVCLHRNSAGVVLDVHSARYTFVTRLVRSGASVQTCRQLARHSTAALTLAVYGRLGLVDLHGALNALPAFDQTDTPPGRAERRAAG